MELSTEQIFLFYLCVLDKKALLVIYLNINNIRINLKYIIIKLTLTSEHCCRQLFEVVFWLHTFLDSVNNKHKLPRYHWISAKVIVGMFECRDSEDLPAPCEQQQPVLCYQRESLTGQVLCQLMIFFGRKKSI